MENILTIKKENTQLRVHPIDNDHEIEIDILDDDGNMLGLLYLTKNDANRAITFLANQLTSIKEEIDILQNH